MTQHWLDGFRMVDPDGKVHGYLWKALLSLDWWIWQVELKTARMRCRLQGHRFDVRLDQRPRDTCTRCDWYDA